MARCQGSNLCCMFFRDDDDEPPPLSSETLGILAFDAAKTMCRLVSLYKSLADVEIHKLRRNIIRSKGVKHLNSQHEIFLLNLACAERVEDLNLAAATVSRLGKKCSNASLSRFDVVYEDMKHGIIDLKKLEFGTRNIEKIIEKMERLVSNTRSLHMAMESLSEMEGSEKKIQHWRAIRANHGLKVKVECFNDRIAYHRRQVQHYKQVSLWNQTFDKVTRLMSRIVCIVYARICAVFGSLITGMPSSNKNIAGNRVFRPRLQNSHCLIQHRDIYRANLFLFDQNEEHSKKRRRSFHMKSTRTGVIQGLPNHHFPLHVAPMHGDGFHEEVAKNNHVFKLAPPLTVGGAGLSMRYANVILFSERCMHATMAIGEDARVALYDMLPERLRLKVRKKLRSQWLKWEENSEGASDGHSSVVSQWREAVEEVMEWLSPVAHDTMRWQAERNLEKQKFDTKPTVLLLQTLHYSDLEKVEEGIVEVLVGLSCRYWYQKNGSVCAW